MSDYKERACSKCGSLVHHEDSCPTPQNTINLISYLTSKLHAYEKQWTEMDYTIGKLRQENAVLKADLISHKAALEKCREALLQIMSPYSCEEVSEMRTRHGGCSAGELCLRDVIKFYDTLLMIESPKQSPTTDPSTDIAYNLYPSSARPVNPKL